MTEYYAKYRIIVCVVIAIAYGLLFFTKAHAHVDLIELRSIRHEYEEWLEHERKLVRDELAGWDTDYDPPDSPADLDSTDRD